MCVCVRACVRACVHAYTAYNYVPVLGYCRVFMFYDSPFMRVLQVFVLFWCNLLSFIVRLLYAICK